ncbi:T9SS type A sorting domain-containing protein [uncultured Bacteroides sp.]|uniref:T9SS type A sorting domain-containing protein n=1 Tax=uncultured Bacteroides sp. TaxID=162156 RepID=UPI002618F1BB|nr:T9SS type A sorting domain-containing protein [uncultured Bacteroides sp.]
MKYIMLLIALCFSMISYCQEVPLPEWCFPLNGTNPEDIMSGRGANVNGTVHAIADRFGAKGRAISFDAKGGYLSFPLTAVADGERKERTFTYWMYAGKESLAQAFWAKDKAGNILLGMSKKGSRALLNIYHTDGRQNVSPDQQWMWDDSNFEEGEGWYFVAIAYSESGTHFYLTTPKGKMTECYSAFLPDWSLLPSLCVGTLDGIPAAGMDDFKVYDEALSKEQVEVLYQSESRFSVGDKALFNVGSNVRLGASTCYFHCVGLQETLRYAVQNQSDLLFVSADAGYALSAVPEVESEHQKWIFTPVKDTAEGSVFTITNCATGMNIADVQGSICQQVADATDSQKWSVNRSDYIAGKANELKQNKRTQPLLEEIYFDKSAKRIRVYVQFAEAENAKVKVSDIQGRLLHELSFSNVTLLEKDIKQPADGIYVVTVESDNCRINRKVFVNN